MPHYGIHGDLEKRAEVVLRFLDTLEAILDEAVSSDMSDEEIDDFCLDRLKVTMRDHLVCCAVKDIEADLDWIGSDTAINAGGVALLAKRIRSEKGQEA